MLTSPIEAYDADGYFFHALGIMADGEVKVAGRSRDVNEKIDTAGFENLKGMLARI